MITFFVALLFLLIGYCTYGRLAECIFGPDDRPTPAVSKADGVNYVEMPTWKVFLIQLLNIAGTGPIFGALMGVCLTQLDFDVIWRYFPWSNQMLAMIALWAAAVYLRKNKGKRECLMAALPATFMSAVSSTYIVKRSTEEKRKAYEIN